METVINDDFPFEELECQYFDTCKYFNGEKCLYNVPCTSVVAQGEYITTLRKIFRKTIDEALPNACLEMQIDLIVHEND